MHFKFAAALSGGDGHKPSQKRANLHQTEVAFDPRALHRDCGPSHDATNSLGVIDAQPESGAPSNALHVRHPASENLSLIQKNTSQIVRDTGLAIKPLELQQSDAKPSFMCEIKDPETDLPCGKVYTQQQLLLRHQRSALHRGEKGSFPCQMCSKSYVFLDRLKKHMRDKHGHEPDSNKAEEKPILASHDHTSNIPSSEDSTVAPSGRQETGASGPFRETARTALAAPNQPLQNSTKTVICTLPILKTGKLCNRVFSLLRGTHNIDQHQNSAVHNIRSSKIFECTECRSQFSSPLWLSNHRRVEHGVRAFRTAEFSDEESDSSDDELPAPSTPVASQSEASNTSSDQDSPALSEDNGQMTQDSGMLLGLQDTEGSISIPTE